MNVIGHKYKFLVFSGLVMLAAITSLAVFGLRQGIEFTGGALWQLRFADKDIKAATLQSFLVSKLTLDNPNIILEEATRSFIIKLKETSEADHQRYLNAIKEEFGNQKVVGSVESKIAKPAAPEAVKDGIATVEELRFESIGPTIGHEIRQRAIWAFILVLLGISLYVALAFRKVSYPVSSWKYGVITLLTLFHDAIIPTGFYALFGHLFGAEIGTNFVVAILVVMGFSVHDTIVVFDRIRENLRLQRVAKFDFDSLVNKSVSDTLARSINTSLTLIIMLAALFFFGSSSLLYFVLTILIGTVFGTYSSIFVASPLLTLWRNDDSLIKKI